jgi:uncharacterized protein (DUF302 family)
MKLLRICATGLLFWSASAAWSADGLVAVKSLRTPGETMDRLEKVLKANNIVVFARLDHAAGAAQAGRKLRPTQLLIFGNPQGGTLLMECAQSAGIDLPMKALAWQDASGQTWLGYNDPVWIAQRHKAPQCAAAAELKKALAAFTASAVAK